MRICKRQQRRGQASRCHQQQCTLQLLSLASVLVPLLLASQQCVAASTFLVGADASVSPSAAPLFAKVKHLVLVFPLKPLSHAPTPPPAYETYPVDQWTWLGGAGYFMITKSDFGPLGVLTEAWYLPGQYQPQSSSKNDVYYSAQRLWVDMEISRDVGRRVWGFPKEMAHFEWGHRSIAVKDVAGKKIFSASFSTALDQAPPAWLTTFANSGLETIQWPIPDSNTAVSGLIEIQFNGGKQSSADAFIAAHLLPNPLVTISNSAGDASGTLIPNTQHLGFNGSSPDAVVPAPGYKQLKLVRATKVDFNAKAFTGRMGREVQLAQGSDVGFIQGTPGSLTNPVKYTW